jgi:hypothetical protein
VLTHAWDEMIRARMQDILERRNPGMVLPPGFAPGNAD